MIRNHVRARGASAFGVRPDEDDDQGHDDHRASVRTTDGSATPTDGAANTTEENP